MLTSIYLGENGRLTSEIIASSNFDYSVASVPHNTQGFLRDPPVDARRMLAVEDYQTICMCVVHEP